MPSRQQSLSADFRATFQLAKLVQWHGDKDPQTTGSHGRGRTRRSCSSAPSRDRSSWRSDRPRHVLATEPFLQ